MQIWKRALFIYDHLTVMQSYEIVLEYQWNARIKCKQEKEFWLSMTTWPWWNLMKLFWNTNEMHVWNSNKKESFDYLWPPDSDAILWNCSGRPKWLTLVTLYTRHLVAEKFSFPALFTNHCGVVPAMGDRWHHLVFVSEELLSFSNRDLC